MPTAGRAVAFLRDRRGATAIEFGLVALPFFILLVGVINIGLWLYMSSALANAARLGARQVLVGSVQANGYSADTFRTSVVCPALPAAFNCGDVIVNLKTVNQASGGYYPFVTSDRSALVLPPLSNGSTAYCPGNANSYELLQLMYPVPAFLAIFAPSARVVMYNGTLSLILMSSAAFKNEAFPYSVTVSPGC